MTAHYQLLRASAGTGKTHRLVEAYAEQILEHGRRPSEVVAITFTRKAAAELRARIKGRLVQAGVGVETLAELARAPINNFHGLALQLLTSAGELLDGVQILGDTGDDRQLFIDACEEAWFGEDAGAGEHVLAVAQAVQVDTVYLPLWDAVARAREDGARIAGAELIGGYDPAALQRKLEAQVQELVSRLEVALPSQSDTGGEKIRAFLHARPRGALDPTGWAAAWSRAAEQLDRRGALGKVLSADELKLLKHEIGPRLHAEAAAARLAPHLAHLLDAAWKRYVEMKHERRALDFGDLVERAVALLESDAERQAEICGRIGAVLVDEAQDTNLLQYRFVELLCGTAGPAVGRVEPASLVIVGDRKQAIYTFRGANPASFDAFAADVLERGGHDLALTKSYRSAPELVQGINHLGRTLFADRYEALEAGEGEPALGRPAMTWLDVPEMPSAAAAILAEASAVAAFAKQRVDEGLPPSDMTLLLSAMGNAPFFASALANAGVPAVLGGGGGLYAQVEIVDLTNLLVWLSDGHSRLPAAVLLRSPIVGASDNALLVLLGRSHSDGKLDSLRRGQLDLERLSLEADRLAVGRLQSVLPRLVEAARVMGAHELVRFVIDTLDLRSVYLALPGGEQRVANLERLTALAEEFERRGGGGVGRFAREQLRRIETGHDEPVTPVPVDERGAVTITTVHQSKGLEFPVVLLADLAHGSRLDMGPMQYHREVGLTFRPSLRGEPQKTERWKEAGRRSRADGEAELQRLLYVAVTRARRDVVFFHAPTEKARPSGFLKLLGPWRPLAATDGVLSQGKAPDKVRPPPPAPAEPPSDGDLAWAQTVLSQARPERAPPGSRFVLPVTELETYVQCLRRGVLVHQIGAQEENIRSRLRAEQLALADPIDPLARGRLAHAVLAALDRRRDHGTARQFIDAELLAAGYNPSDARLGDLVLDLDAFLASPLGLELCALPATHRRHEMPFQLALDAAPYAAVVHGQIDLLYWDAEGPVVVDFKHAKSSGPGLSAYATQLAAYASAVARLSGSTDPVRTRLVFLKEHQRPPMNRVVTAEMRAELEQEVAAVVRSLAAAQARRDVWPGRPRKQCMLLDCGFVERCHGKTKGAGQATLALG